MFVIEVQQHGVWVLERGDYFTHDGPAITEAKRRQAKDGVERRVMTWPGPAREVWPTQQEPTGEAA
jgi:hypothetical protein